MNKLVYAISRAVIVPDKSKLNVLYLKIGNYIFKFVNGAYSGRVFEGD